MIMCACYCLIDFIALPFFRYEEISRCWDEVPENRPCFEDLAEIINSLLEGVAGYLDFSIFSGISPTKSGYDHLAGTRYDHLENVSSRGYDHLQIPLSDEQLDQTDTDPDRG